MKWILRMDVLFATSTMTSLRLRHARKPPSLSGRLQLMVSSSKGLASTLQRNSATSSSTIVSPGLRYVILWKKKTVFVN